MESTARSFISSLFTRNLITASQRGLLLREWMQTLFLSKLSLRQASKKKEADETYGIELPDTNTLIRRAATYRAKG
jgi:hypothetical protein